MSSNTYFGVKDAEFDLSFAETQWLSLNEALIKLQVHTKSHFTLSPSNLIYPNELVLSETNCIIDCLLLARYTDKCGNLKLKSVLLSQLITESDALQNSCSFKANRLYVLSLPKDSYYWTKVDAHLIPRYALRVGYDSIAKQFSYIGRMRINNATSSPPRLASKTSGVVNVSNTLTGIIGTITNLYEYIPAIVLQLHDLSYSYDEKLFNNINSTNQAPQQQPQHQLHEYFNHNNSSLSNESFWSRLRAAINNNTHSSSEFNFNYLLWNNYEVLCLKKQPLKLKQLAILSLKRLEEITMVNIINYRHQQHHSSSAAIDQVNLNKALRTLPTSIRNLVWPSHLEHCQCLVKNSKMRSANGAYELEINSKGD